MGLSARLTQFILLGSLFITFAESAAQIIAERTYDRLDSLLAKGNFIAITDFFAEQEARNQKFKLSDKDQGAFDMSKSSYLSTIKNIVDSDKISAERAAVLHERIKANAKDFDIEAAGEEAAAYFSKFNNLLTSAKRAEAFKNYYLARHWLAQYQRNAVRELETLLAQSAKRLAEKKFALCLRLLQQAEMKTKAPFIGKEYRSRILRMKQQLGKSRIDTRLENELSGRIATPKYAWSILLGGQFMGNLRLHDVTWNITVLSPIYRDSLYSYDLTFDLLQESGFGSALALTHNLSNKVQIEIQAARSRFDYQLTRASHRNGIETTNFKIDYYFGHLKLNYFLRAQIGIRYWAGAGIGYAQARRPQIERDRGISGCCTPERSRAEQVRTLLFTPGAGVEYIPHASSRLSYRVLFGANYNLERSQLLSRVNLYSNLMAALRF